MTDDRAPAALIDAEIGEQPEAWRRLLASEAVARTAEFVAVGLEDAAVRCAGERSIEVELRRGAVTMKLTWPLSAMADFAAWTRELLR